MDRSDSVIARRQPLKLKLAALVGDGKVWLFHHVIYILIPQSKDADCTLREALFLANCSDSAE